MTAIGVGISTRDKDYSPWTTLYKHSKKQTQLELDYIEAKQEAQDLWDEHKRTIDWGEETMTKLSETDPVRYWAFRESYLWQVEQLECKAVAAERTQHRLYTQINCAHEFEDYQDGADDVKVVCSKCGLRG